VDYKEISGGSWGFENNWRVGDIKDDKYDNLEGGLLGLQKLNGTVIYSTGTCACHSGTRCSLKSCLIWKKV
jgi:hypothetical protein